MSYENILIIVRNFVITLIIFVTLVNVNIQFEIYQIKFNYDFSFL